MAVVETVSYACGHNQEASGVPLVTNAACLTYIYLKNSQSNQKFFPAFLFQKQAVINQAHAVVRSNGLARGDNRENQVPSKVPSRKEWAKNQKTEARLLATAEQVVGGKCAPPDQEF